MRWTPRSAALATALMLIAQQGLAQVATPKDGPSVGAEVEPAGPGLSGARSAAGARSTIKLGIEQLVVEAGAFPDAREADHTSYLRVSPFISWQPNRDWELRLAGRFDATDQSGGTTSYVGSRGVLGDSFVRYRSGDTRITVGTQTILWGRVDAVPVIDRVSRVDLERFALDDLQDRRLPQFALRVEQSFGDYRLDTVLVPRSRGAALPDTRSVWSPINRISGEVIGIAPTTALSNFIAGATIRDESRGSGGGAVRLTRTGVEPVDFGLTLARTRQPLPYYRLDAADYALTVVHPFNTFVGVDAEFSAMDVTWRTELGSTRGVTATAAASGTMLQVRQTEWVGGAELFPGGKDTRLTLQIAARWLHAQVPVLELKRYVGVNGEVESTFAKGRWRFSLRFFSGLNVRDVYLAPKLSFVGWEPHELYVTARYFDGESRTLAGFHRDHQMVAIGLKTRF